MFASSQGKSNEYDALSSLLSMLKLNSSMHNRMDPSRYKWEDGEPVAWDDYYRKTINKKPPGIL